MLLQLLLREQLLLRCTLHRAQLLCRCTGRCITPLLLLQLLLQLRLLLLCLLCPNFSKGPSDLGPLCRTGHIPSSLRPHVPHFPVSR